MAKITFDAAELNLINSQEKFVNGNIAVYITDLASVDYFAILKAAREQGSQNNRFLEKINACSAAKNVGISVGEDVGSTFLDIENHKQEILALLEVLGYGDAVNDDNITDIVKVNDDQFLESTGFVLASSNSDPVEDGGLYAYEFSNEFGSYLLSFSADALVVCVYFDNGGSYSSAFAFTAIESN